MEPAGSDRLPPGTHAMSIGPNASRTGTLRLALAALSASLALLATCPARAADDEDADAEDTADGPWSLILATLVDQQSARAFEGSLGYAFTPDTSVTVGANSSDSTSNSATGLGTSAVALGVSHDLERFGFDAMLTRWQATDLVAAKELRAGPEFRADAWSLSPRLELRRSVFEPIRFTGSVTLPDGTVLPVAATAHCTLRNFGFGLVGDYEGAAWGGHLEGMRYQYADASCSFNAPGLGALGHAGRDLLRQLLGPGADRLARAVARRIGRSDALLDSELGGGASWRHEDLKLSLDYARTTDFLVRVRSDTLAATATADLGSGTGVDMTLGATRSSFGTIAFVGFAVRAKF